jgi:hypothetical protein
MTDEEKFMRFVMPEPNSGCWLWVGGEQRYGYGSFRLNKKGHMAHKFSYEMYKEKVPDGMVILHKCDVTACVNPDHLEVGTQADNLKDMHDRGRNNQPFGDHHSNATLTSDKVREIKIALRDKKYVSFVSLAKSYGITASALYEIRIGKNWKQIII